jgi:glucose-1-phosphatase
MSYKVLLFDLGKVVFDVSFELTYAYWAEASGQELDQIRDRFNFDEDYEGFEKSAFPPEEFRKRISEKLNLHLTDIDFDKGWCNLYKEVYPGMDDFLGKWSSSYRLAALTNTNTIHETVWKPKYSHILRHFEKVFSSPAMACRKPEPACYRMVLDELQVAPEEVLFMDDNKDNIEGAKAMGIHCILVESAEQMMREVEALLR